MSQDAKELDYFDPEAYELDSHSATKVNAFRNYSRQALADILENPADLLIDCNHKSWSGVVNGVVYDYLDAEGNYQDTINQETTAVRIGILDNDDELVDFQATVNVTGLPLYHKVRHLFVALIACLDHAVGIEAAEPEEEADD